MIDYSCHYDTRNDFRIKGEIVINENSKKLWKIITEPGHLKQFHPFCKKHEHVKWQGVGDKDAPQLYSGKITYREIVKWEEGIGFQIKMNNGDGNSISVDFFVAEDFGGSVKFGIEIKTDSYRKTPRPIWKWFAKKKLLPSYEIYLHSILNGLKYFAETGIRVERNQFGSHPKFSPVLKNK